MRFKTLVFVLFIGFTLIAGGCVAKRAIIDLQTEISATDAFSEAVKFVRVSDIRSFEKRPASPSIPSIKYGEIDNKAITSRAIARIRLPYGKAKGDILLPEGRTVADVVQEVVTKAFRESGYRVVSQDDPDYASAQPVEVEIERFWAWYTTGVWVLRFDFDSHIKITGGPVAFENGKEITAKATLLGQGAAKRQWRNTFNAGLKALLEEIKKELGS